MLYPECVLLTVNARRWLSWRNSPFLRRSSISSVLVDVTLSEERKHFKFETTILKINYGTEKFPVGLLTVQELGHANSEKGGKNYVKRGATKVNATKHRKSCRP